MAFSDLWLLEVIDVKCFKFFIYGTFFSVLRFLFVVFTAFFYFNKNSVVAEMGDRSATIGMGRKWG